MKGDQDKAWEKHKACWKASEVMKSWKEEICHFVQPNKYLTQYIFFGREVDHSNKPDDFQPSKSDWMPQLPNHPDLKKSGQRYQFIHNHDSTSKIQDLKQKKKTLHPPSMKCSRYWGTVLYFPEYWPVVGEYIYLFERTYASKSVLKDEQLNGGNMFVFIHITLSGHNRWQHAV